MWCNLKLLNFIFLNFLFSFLFLKINIIHVEPQTRFISRDRPIITDSGGFQVFSLQTVYSENSQDSKQEKVELKGQSKNKCYTESLVKKVTEDGVTFRSYRDGKLLKLTPEESVTAQHRMGSDIIIPFDELLPEHVPMSVVEESLERTHRWELRSLECHKKLARLNHKNQHMYCVLHGGTNFELRKKSMDVLLDESCFQFRDSEDGLPNGFEGIAIGGSLGSNRSEMLNVLKFTYDYMDKKIPTGCAVPNHILGIGDIESINSFIDIGFDTCDSAYPTRYARHGNFIVHAASGFPSSFSIRNSNHLKSHDRPIDVTCDCPVCFGPGAYSIAYLHHLFKMSEPIYITLASIHNVRQMMIWMETIRKRIKNNEI